MHSLLLLGAKVGALVQAKSEGQGQEGKGQGTMVQNCEAKALSVNGSLWRSHQLFTFCQQATGDRTSPFLLGLVFNN